MAQQQHAADVHPDELCPPNKRYDLMDANKKVDLEHTPSAPRSPTLKKDTAESCAPKRSTMIRLRLLESRSTRLTPPVPVPTVEQADEIILQDTLQVSLVKHRSREEQEARENVELVNKHLASKLIKKLEPRSDKERPEVESTNDEEVEVTNVVIPVNELQGRYTYLFEHLKERFLSRKSFDTLADHLQEVMVESLPTMVDTHIKDQVKKQVPEQVRDQVPVVFAEGADSWRDKRLKKRWNGWLLKLFYKSAGIYKLNFPYKSRKLLIIRSLLKLMRQYEVIVWSQSL
ncbi:hypothetical protein Tco_1506319 [Tanacetum coccineum]